MDKLSVCRILLLERKPKLGCTKPWLGHPQVGHSWYRDCLFSYYEYVCFSKLQRAATFKSKNTNLFAIYASV